MVIPSSRRPLKFANAIFWIGLGIILPKTTLTGCLLIGGAALIAHVVFFNSQTIRGVFEEHSRKRWRTAGILAIVLLTLGAAALIPPVDRANSKALAELGNGHSAIIEAQGDLRQKSEEIGDLLKELTKRVESQYPGVTGIRPLPQPPGSSDQIDLAMGKMSLRLTLLSADAEAWLYRIDSFDFEGQTRIHARNSTLRVPSGQTTGLVAGNDFCLVVSVIELGPGKKIPWIGLVPVKNRPPSIWVVPVDLL